MLIFPSIEANAERRKDCVAKLQYLRRRTARRRREVSIVRIAAVSLLLFGGNQLGRSKVAPAVPIEIPVAKRETVAPAKMWMVEQTEDRLLYSNGLSVHRAYRTQSEARQFRVYSRETLQRSPAIFRMPVGIVFHTTESLILPLEAARNQALLKSRESVLEHARQGRLYNFLIDRFGQVFAIVPEEQTALHAGHSVWGSGEQVWINLNASFLGVSFEAESTVPFQPTAAQVHAGRLLTDMLRARYEISDENCVTHAQVSVNPDNMRIGYHTDWGSAFPFHELGLTAGYDLPLASITLFGFVHDKTFLAATGNQPWPGLLSSDRQLANRAAQMGLTAAQLSTQLQHHYTNLRRRGYE